MKIEAAPSKGGKAVDLLGIGCFEGEKDPLARSRTLDSRMREPIAKALSAKKFSGKAGETFFLPLSPGRGAAAVFLLGLGKREKHTLEKVRRAASRLLAQAKMFRSESARIDVDSLEGGFSPEDTAAACVEGLRLSDYRFLKYKSKNEPPQPVKSVELAFGNPSDGARVKKSIAQAEIVSDSIAFTRDLANEPANVMTPQRLAEAARKMARETGLSCRVFGKEELRRMKMGGILGVAQGSIHPPQLVILEHKGGRPNDAPYVFVGKGITFDTGGISIKPSGDMDKMKFDMCGAAAVIGTLRACAKLKIPARVIGITPICENMPGSKAQRPGDIIRISNGKTVEVLNTDAEGRLILADALSYAAKFKPRVLVDIATLTGACSAAFSDICSGLMTTDRDLGRRLTEAGDRAGERVWELPLWDEYAELIRATYADIQNISRKSAGTITAGMFLKEFADHTRAWAHLDVAGTAWADGPKPLGPIGSTGVGVRLFLELLRGYTRRG